MQITALRQSRDIVVCVCLRECSSRSWNGTGLLHHVITQPSTTDNSAAFRCAVSVSAGGGCCLSCTGRGAGRAARCAAGRASRRTAAQACAVRRAAWRTGGPCWSASLITQWACLSLVSDLTPFYYVNSCKAKLREGFLHSKHSFSCFTSDKKLQ